MKTRDTAISLAIVLVMLWICLNAALPVGKEPPKVVEIKLKEELSPSGHDVVVKPDDYTIMMKQRLLEQQELSQRNAAAALGSSTAGPTKTPPTTSLQTPAKHKMCMIATWSGSTLPPYYRLFIDSVKRNNPYVKLFLFYHLDVMSRLSEHPESIDNANQTLNPNIQYIDIANIDASYKYRKWPGFISDQNIGRKDCALYELGLHSVFELLISVRGMYGKIFEQWVNTTNCEAWAWTDIDVILGDFKYWFNENSLTKNADVWTMGGGDLERHYIRGQLAVHNLVGPRGADVVNNLWIHCRAYANFPYGASPQELRSLYYILDEGCYSKGILNAKGLTVVVLHWQLPSWGNYLIGAAESTLIAQKAILGCTNKNATSCVAHFKQILNGLAMIADNQNDPSYKPAKPNTPSIIFSQPPLSSLQITLDHENRSCCGWIPASGNLCTKLDFVVNNNFIQVTVHKGPENIQLQTYPKVISSLYAGMRLPPAFEDGISAVQQPETPDDGIFESPMMHFQYWKDKMIPSCGLGWDDSVWSSTAGSKDHPWLDWGNRIFDSNRKCSIDLA